MLKSKLDASPRWAVFWRRLMTPPVVPAPKVSEDGPFRTWTSSVVKLSRT